MSKRAAAEQAQAEAQARAAFKILSGQIETILLNAGWSQAVRDGESVPFVRSHGDLVILAGVDAFGHNHSAASKNGLSLAEYLAALDLRLRVPRPAEPEPAPEPAPPPTPSPREELEATQARLKDALDEIERMKARPPEVVERVVEKIVEKVVEVPAAPPPAADDPGGEPLPDPLARLVPNSIADEERKQWLLSRWQTLTHKLMSPDAFGELTEAERVEHQELERYRGLFT